MTTSSYSFDNTVGFGSVNFTEVFFEKIEKENNENNNSLDYSNLSYVKQLGSINIDDYDIDEDLQFPYPLFRMNVLNEYSPPFKEQMEKLYTLQEGKKYKFVENYPLQNSKYENNSENKNKIIGIFHEYVDKNIFRFIVDGVPYLTSRINFEKRIKGCDVDFEEI